MFSIRRSCQSALSTSRTSGHILNDSRRAFSRSSALRRGSLPVFLEPSSSELATKLSLINSKILLPAHLTPEQEQLVYKQKNRARLEAETIEITLGDVTLPLEHINRLRDVPPRWDTLNEVIDLSETTEDWENVVRMVEGYENASIHLDKKKQEKVVRALNANGMQHLVLKALQRAEKTGMRLKHENWATYVMLGFHSKAAESEWDAAETKKALGFAEQVVEMMEGDAHLGKEPFKAGDLRRNPFIIAIPLNLAAMRAKKHTKGKDEDGKVKKYAQRLLNAHAQDPISLNNSIDRVSKECEKKQFKTNWEKRESAIVLRRELEVLAPLISALRLSNQILKADMPLASEAKKIEKKVSKTLEDAQAKLEAINSTFNDPLITASVAEAKAARSI